MTGLRGSLLLARGFQTQGPGRDPKEKHADIKGNQSKAKKEKMEAEP